MRAVRNTEDGIRVVDWPPIRAEGVRVSVASSGICGSDLHLVSFGPSAVTLGHEFCGRLDDGTPVAVLPVVTCGLLPACLAGDEQQCPDGSRSHVRDQPRRWAGRRGVGGPGLCQGRSRPDPPRTCLPGGAPGGGAARNQPGRCRSRGSGYWSSGPAPSACAPSPPPGDLGAEVDRVGPARQPDRGRRTTGGRHRGRRPTTTSCSTPPGPRDRWTRAIAAGPPGRHHRHRLPVFGSR